MVPVAYDQVRVPIILPSSVAGKLHFGLQGQVQKIFLNTQSNWPKH